MKEKTVNPTNLCHQTKKITVKLLSLPKEWRTIKIRAVAIIYK